MEITWHYDLQLLEMFHKVLYKLVLEVIFITTTLNMTSTISYMSFCSTSRNPSLTKLVDHILNTETLLFFPLPLNVMSMRPETGGEAAKSLVTFNILSIVLNAGVVDIVEDG
jgi:hypothetical protein